MKKLRITGWRISLVVVTMIALLLAAAGLMSYVFETRIVEYETFAEAQAAGATEGGWLPTFLPASATDIRDVHNIDTNAQWLSFKAPSGDLRQMLQGFKALSYAEARRTVLPRPWRVGGKWPRELSEPLLATPRDTEIRSAPSSPERPACGSWRCWSASGTAAGGGGEGSGFRVQGSVGVEG